MCYGKRYTNFGFDSRRGFGSFHFSGFGSERFGSIRIRVTCTANKVGYFFG